MPRDCSHLVLKSTAKGGNRGQSTKQKRLKRGKKEKKKNLSLSVSQIDDLSVQCIAFCPCLRKCTCWFGYSDWRYLRTEEPGFCSLSHKWGMVPQRRKQEKRQLPRPKAQMGVLLQDTLFQDLNSSIYYKPLVFTSCLAEAHFPPGESLSGLL